MNGKQAKKLRAAARVYMTRVAAPVQTAELRIAKKHPDQELVVNGEKMSFPRQPSLVAYWAAGSERRAEKNLKRAWKEGRFTERKIG